MRSLTGGAGRERVHGHVHTDLVRLEEVELDLVRALELVQSALVRFRVLPFPEACMGHDEAQMELLMKPMTMHREHCCHRFNRWEEQLNNRTRRKRLFTRCHTRWTRCWLRWRFGRTCRSNITATRVVDLVIRAAQLDGGAFAAECDVGTVSFGQLKTDGVRFYKEEENCPLKEHGRELVRCHSFATKFSFVRCNICFYFHVVFRFGLKYRFCFKLEF